MNLFRNQRQREILWSDSGVSRWHAAPVAAAIVRRVLRAGHVTIRQQDVADVRRIHEVLHSGSWFSNPFHSLASDLHSTECTAAQLDFEQYRK